MFIYVVTEDRVIREIFHSLEEAQEFAKELSGQVYIMMRDMSTFIGHYYEDVL